MAVFLDPKSGGCSCTREKCSDECVTYRHFKPKPFTNADRIRAMTDEELAELLNRMEPKFCHAGFDYMIGCLEDKDCVVCWLDWLKQEVDDG